MSSIKPHIALQWIIAGLTALSGVLSEVVDATSTRVGSFSNLHLLFGVMLCLGVICRLWYGLRRARGQRLPDIAAFARQLTRSVYGLLYLLLAVKMLLPYIGADPTSPESFRPYLVSAVAAIVLARGAAVMAMIRGR